MDYAEGDAGGGGKSEPLWVDPMHGFGWIDANGDGTNDVFVDANGDGINDQSGYHYDGGYQYHQGSGGNTGMPNVTWPMGQHGGGMMND